MSIHVFEVSAIVYFFGLALVWGVCGRPRALAKNEDGRSSFPPGVVLLISLCALVPLLHGCSGEERETFRVEQRSEYPIPGLPEAARSALSMEGGATHSSLTGSTTTLPLPTSRSSISDLPINRDLVGLLPR